MFAYLQKPAVQLTLFLVAVGGAGAFFYLQNTGRIGGGTVKPPPKGMGQSAAEDVTMGRKDILGNQTAESTHLDKLVLPPPAPDRPAPAPEKPKVEQKPKPPTFPALVQMSHPPHAKPFAPQPPSVFAPRGTLIKAALVITLESNVAGTPVLGMVTDDVYFQGNLIVPAGTQVQGASMGNSKIRDRLDVRGTFTFIWTDGSEYCISGIALDHEPLPDGTYALTDGSPGIKGRVLKTDDYAELKLLIAQVVQGFVQTQQDTFQSVYGLVPTNSVRNSGLGGGAAGAGSYSNLLAKKIEKDVEYVQVPAGTQFYIYTLDVFEPELRSIAGIRQGNSAKNGIDLQKEAYTLATTQAAQSQEDLKAQLEDSHSKDAAAARSAQFERTRALLSPTTGAGSSGSPYGSASTSGASYSTGTPYSAGAPGSQPVTH